MEQTERQLFSLLSEITPLYDAPMREAKARQDALAKPPGSLGLLEELAPQATCTLELMQDRPSLDWLVKQHLLE